jgi:hypothetical protein
VVRHEPISGRIAPWPETGNSALEVSISYGVRVIFSWERHRLRRIAGSGAAIAWGHECKLECAERYLKDNEAMTGIQYVTDDKGRKVAVQIDLKKYCEPWEDIEDALISRSRRREKRIPLDKVKEGLVKSGKVGSRGNPSGRF